MEYFVAAVFIVILILIALSLLTKKDKVKEEGLSIIPEKDQRTCPLCGSVLQSGWRVHSTVYREIDSTDQMMHIYGCPFCYPNHKQSHLAKGQWQDRYCPVCKEKLKSGIPVYARVFNKPHKTHVHVLGCPKCRKESK
ncbi:hypothetical protein [Spirochaeta cellobiosiphila]|uniref:hypothetical protein n=1 Tax=Spirochaeta cellobiosiphila TaxID=504483 RepID=UPI000408290E|nr:hypothetical protein [Spirochaeta cellobiosiphila]